MEKLSYPARILATPYGDLTITWIDPEADNDYARLRGEYREWNRSNTNAEYLATSEELVINGIGLKIRDNFRIAMDYEDSIPTGQFVLRSCGGSYNRRLDEKEWDWSAGYAKKYHSEVANLITDFVALYPELKIEAHKVTLVNLALAAEDKVKQINLELEKARKLVEDAKNNLSLFLKENS